MKNKTAVFLTLTLLAFIYSSFVSPEPKPGKSDSIKWMSWSEAIALNKKNPKKIFIDVYTHWCGWCKNMDKLTFKDKTIVNYLNDNFYAVKLNAEQKEDIVYDGHRFKFVKNGRRGSHELAASLLNNTMSYPSFVLMSEEMKRIVIVKGFQKTDDLLQVLHFANLNKYKTKTFQEFKATWKK